jgi:opacity protein-like surface antigen
MKSVRTLFFVTFLILVSTVRAQSFDAFVLAGPVVSQVDGDYLGGYNKLGVVGGLGVSYDIKDKLSGILELSYIQKGKGMFNKSDFSSTKTVLNYLQMPLLVTYEVMPKLKVEGGFSIGLLLSYKFIEDGIESSDFAPYTPNAWDVDWLVGARYDFTDVWSLNLRFAYSLFPMGDEIEDDVYSPDVWRNSGAKYNRSIALALMYWF